MRFVITGASKETGEDVELTVAVADSKQAEQIAHEKGILVSAIKEVIPEVDSSPIAMDDDPLADGGGAAVATMPATVGQARTLGKHEDGDPFAEEARAAALRKSAVPEETTGTQYKVIINPNLMLMCISVNHALKEGWELQGGVATCVLNNATQYLQAIVHHGPGGKLSHEEGRMGGGD